MPFEDVMTTVSRWLVAAEALAAVGAELTLLQAPERGHPEVTGACSKVSSAPTAARASAATSQRLTVVMTSSKGIGTP